MIKSCWLHSLGLVFFILCFTLRCEAKVKLPALVSDGMVLQHGRPVNVWGTAHPGEVVTVSFLNKKLQTVADPQGNWQVTLPAMKPGGPYVMIINELQLKDILVGDVWLCSGQSNMELPVSRVLDLFRAEAEADSNPMIRHIKVPLAYNFHAPQKEISGTAWRELTPQHAMLFSALAYFFAKEWVAKTNIPVGLINSSVGGSPVEAWISEEGLKEFPQYLNDKQMYESDAYVAEVQRLDALRQSLWNIALYRGDAGLHESQPWYATDYKDTGWQTTHLLATDWASDGLNPRNGSHWFRREFEVPASLAAQEAVLRMGCMVDADSVYVNGVFVGSVSYQYPPRIYPIPANLLRAGKNQITVRLISYGGTPRFVPDKPYKLVFGKEEFPLQGEWKYKQGCAMPSLPGQTFFQYKPEGLYNAMIAPLLAYTTAGVIWYQGESNVARHNEYASLLTALITDWRTQMQRPDLPFYLIELAGFLAPQDSGQPAWAALRKAQAAVADKDERVTLIPNSDLGEWNDIHPLDKKTLGKRVADAAWLQLKTNY